MKTDVLVFITAEDAELEEYMALYASDPDKFVLGPKGGDKIVAFMRDCAEIAHKKSFVTIDDNIEKLDFCAAGGYRPLTIKMWHDLLDVGSKLLRRQPFFSVAAYYNPEYHYEKCLELGAHYARDKQRFLTPVKGCGLLYTALLGVSVSLPKELSVSGGGGQGDVERTTKTLLRI